jgi:hypothetical protein
MRFAIEYDIPQPAYGQLVGFSSWLAAGAARSLVSRAFDASEMRQLACRRGIRLAVR